MIGIITILTALGQHTRLEVLTLLSRGPADGQTSGDLAIQARVPANSMSTHLSILAAAGLVRSTRSGRKVVYRIEREAIDGALGNLSARLDDPARSHFDGASCWKAVWPIADTGDRPRRAVGFGPSDRLRCSAVIGGVADHTTCSTQGVPSRESCG